jgi:hypothetical protein
MITPKLREDLITLGKSGFAKTLNELIDVTIADECDIDVPKSWDETVACQKHKKFLLKLRGLLDPKTITVDKKRDQYR